MLDEMKYKPINSCDGIYKNSLDVRFTKVCDNRCSFCIEQAGIDHQIQNIDKMIEATIDSGKSTILILGGEPCINLDNLYKYILGIRAHVFNIYITTSLPKSIEDNYELFTKILDQIDGLNVSLQHYNWKKNNEILHATNNYNRINLLQKICETYTDLVRVSINLVKGAIDSKNEIDKFLNVMEKIGVSHVKINELQNCSDTYVSFEKTYGVTYLSPYVHGCQTEIILPKHTNIKITLKRACGFIEPNFILITDEDMEKYHEKTRWPKEVNQNKVLYEDGTLCTHWKTK